MSDDKKVIFSMVKVCKDTPAGKQVLKDVYLSFFYGAKIGIIGVNGSDIRRGHANKVWRNDNGSYAC